MGQEDFLEGEMATRSSIFAWRIPWAEEPDGPRLWGHKRVGHDLATKQTKNCPPNSSRLSDNIKQFPVLNS